MAEPWPISGTSGQLQPSDQSALSGDMDQVSSGHPTTQMTRSRQSTGRAPTSSIVMSTGVASAGGFVELCEIEFSGYKRLANTKCNVRGKTVALVGPNEAGKTSVLTALQWLTVAGSPELPRAAWARAVETQRDSYIARAYFELDERDHQALASLNIDPSRPVADVTQFRISRQRGGSQRTGITPDLVRRTETFVAAVDHAASVSELFAGILQKLDEEEGADAWRIATEIESTAATIQRSFGLGADDGPWDADAIEERGQLITRLAELLEQAGDERELAKQLTGHRRLLNRTEPILRRALEDGEKAHPSAAVRALLRARSPRFLLFGDEHRSIDEGYHLGDEGIRNNPPKALVNLLAVAGTNVETIWRVLSEGSVAEQQSMRKEVNRTLLDRLSPVWSQTRLTVELDIHHDGYTEVSVFELDNKSGVPMTPISERSDGLRAFLGLVVFVLSNSPDHPPVLLIDEAERNLHYDAQADLVRVLTNELKVAKVIYTTHSPGCLPLDLGTGIRVTERVDDLRSELRNNFWTDTESGFSRLLFAMGAGAAAFSAFRKAVLTEGVSEMLLLPTMLRNATGGGDLDFQVAFGLSNMPARKTIGRVALITCYLVDGDSSGDTKIRHLKRAGVPASHIFQAPRGKAIEDLVDPRDYLEALNSHLARAGHPSVTRAELDSSLTIAKAIEVWCNAKGIAPPGHKLIAFDLAQRGADLRLTAAGRKFLGKLRTGLENAFDAEPYLLRELDDDE